MSSRVPGDQREPMWRRYLRFLRSDIGSDVDEELAFHLEMRSRAYEARGLAGDEARRAARQRFGDVDAVARWLRRHDLNRERARRAREIMSSVGQNLRVGVRGLRKQLTFTIPAVLTLALGIGATTAMFSVVYGVLLRPLPFREPDRLVRLWTEWSPGFWHGAVSAANWRDWRALNHVFEDVALIQDNRSFNLATRDDPERLRGALVTANLFTILRGSPILGRTFTDAENEIGRDKVVVLSHGLWVRRFGADRSVIGRSITLNGVATTVVGVMPGEFQFPAREIELWMPITVPADEYLHRFWGSYSTIARLKPGITLDQARADLAVVSATLARQYTANKKVQITLAPLLDDMVGTVRRPLLILLGAVAAMLLIGCANLANLLQARGIARRRELAVRTALGASRARLVEQSVTELLPLLGLGGGLGFVLAAWITHAIVPLLPSDIPRAEAIGINFPVLAFTTATIVVIALLVGVWPAIDAAKRSVTSTIAELSRGSTSAAGHTRVRDLLVIGQIAATLLLLIGATVLMRSFLAARDVSPGFNPDHVLTVKLSVPRTKYPLDRDIAAFYGRALDRIQALPGVTAVGLVSRLPLGGDNQTGSFQFESVDGSPWSPNFQTRTASPDYFRALEIPILSGRSFIASDGIAAPPVAVVDEQLARLLWPGMTALGRRIRESTDAPWATVVGIVGHIRHTALDDGDVTPQVYWNYSQRVEETMALVVKTRADPATLTRSVAAAIRDVDRDQPIFDARPLDAVVGRSLGQRWLQTALLGTFAAAALVLASIGAYGVIAYGVTQRRRELGVRMALGAQQRDVLAMILRRGATLFALGAAIGLALAVAAVRLLSTLVYGIAPRDAISFVFATVVLLIVSLIACFVPARRAARIDPSVALRVE